MPGVDRKSLALTGDESISISGLAALSMGQKVSIIITDNYGQQRKIETLCRIDTATELIYFQHGGILHYVIRSGLSEPI